MLILSCNPGTVPSSEPSDHETISQTFSSSFYSSAPSEISEMPKTEELLIDKMTLEEKIGQLFIIAPEYLNKDYSSEHVDDPIEYGMTGFTDQMAVNLNKYNIGGVIFFSENIEYPLQIRGFVDELQKNSEIPLFIATDEEGGTVARIANSQDFDVTKFSNMKFIGETNDPEKAREVGEVIGAYMKDLGFNLDFAPVADVNTNPENIVIGSRAFGSDPELVAKMITEVISGLHNSGIMSCIKHFPGHGDTTSDSHSGSVSVSKTWEELLQCEIIPFKAGIEAETDMIMTAHIIADNISGEGAPASLSEVMITEKLRNELGFNGIVITDSMSMGAVTGRYSPGEAAVLALKAGADIILMPEDLDEAFRSVLEAVSSGVLSEARIDMSVMRILEQKVKYGIIDR